jgi:calcineurin-like phosphoesterase
VRRLGLIHRGAEGTGDARFVRKMPGERPQVADGEATLCGIFLETDDRSGLARVVEPVRIGGRLMPHLPPH